MVAIRADISVGIEPGAQPTHVHTGLIQFINDVVSVELPARCANVITTFTCLAQFIAHFAFLFSLIDVESCSLAAVAQFGVILDALSLRCV